MDICSICSVPLRPGANYNDIPIKLQEWLLASADASKPRQGYKKGEWALLLAVKSILKDDQVLMSDFGMTNTSPP